MVLMLASFIVVYCCKVSVLLITFNLNEVLFNLKCDGSDQIADPDVPQMKFDIQHMLVFSVKNAKLNSLASRSRLF